jgi:glucose dehydrogenase
VTRYAALLVLSSLLIPVSASRASAAPGDEAWRAAYDIGADESTDIIVAPDGSAVYVVGTSFTPEGPFGVVTAYLASDGAFMWRWRGRSVELRDAVQSPDGARLYVTGVRTTKLRGEAARRDIVVVALDTLIGTRAWKAITGSRSLAEEAVAIAMSPAGDRVFVTGSRSNDYFTVGYSAGNGAVVWRSSYDGGARDVAMAIAASRTGDTVYVTGENRNSETESRDVLTLALDATTGATLWNAEYNGATGSVDTGRWVSPGPNDSVLVAGTSYAPINDERCCSPGPLVLALDASTGSVIWDAPFHPDDGGIFGSAGLAPDDSLVFVSAGTFVDSPTEFDEDVLTLAVDTTTGALMWEARFEDAFDAGSPVPLAVDPSGGKVFVGGRQLTGADRYSRLTIAYDAATGVELWSQTFENRLGVDVRALASDATGSRVFTTGPRFRTDFDRDTMTVAYEA